MFANTNPPSYRLPDLAWPDHYYDVFHGHPFTHRSVDSSRIPLLRFHFRSRFFRATPPLRVVLLRLARLDRANGFDRAAPGPVRLSAFRIFSSASPTMIPSGPQM
jgi:hypothetical protein